ncbi:MAG: hypothetical protein OQL19_12095 [Gammaproteobacteria bacterium]|nr:hypothetical protein [Gammaproteobacteria bacterium]
MKKILLLISLLISVFMHQSVFSAAQGSGTVQEVMVCTGHVGETRNPGWGKLGLFKLSDGNWFGSFIHFYSTTPDARSSSAIHSTALSAFSTGAQVEVNIISNRVYTVCGITAPFFHYEANDSILIKK